jgi:hypothetical protein
LAAVLASTAVLASKGKASIAPANIPFRDLILYPLYPFSGVGCRRPKRAHMARRAPLSSLDIAAAVEIEI